MKCKLGMLITFTLGMIVGALIFWLYYYQTLQSIAEVGQDMFSSAMYTYEINEAKLQAKNPNHDVAIYSLNRALKNLQEFESSRRYDCRVRSFEYATLHINLARHYKEIGNVAAHEAHVKMALKDYANFGWKLSNIDELKLALPLIENDEMKKAVQKFGIGVKPGCLKE